MNKENYFDLVEVINRQEESYTDFEGLANGSFVRQILDHPQHQAHFRVYKETLPELEDLTAHWIYEWLDQAGFEPGFDAIDCFIESVAYVLSSRYWMRSDI